MANFQAKQADREERIIYEIVVDAYNEQERASGWWHYLDEKLATPFSAKCSKKLSVSPLKVGEIYEVTGMADFEDCEDDMLVYVKYEGDELALPLEQLECVADEALDEDIQQAVEDWHYWVEQGYSF